MKAVRITLGRPPRFQRHERDRDFFHVGQKLRGCVWLDGPGRPKTCEVRWLDARGRLCGVTAGKLVAAERHMAFEFTLDHSIVPSNRIECSIDGVDQGLREPFIISPPHEPWLDLHTFTWASYPIGPIYDQLQAIGIDGAISYKMSTYEAIVESGFKCYVDQACPDEISTYHRPYLQYWEAPAGEEQAVAGNWGYVQRWQVLQQQYKRARKAAAPLDVAAHAHFRKLLWREHCPNDPGVRKIAFERFNELVKMKMGIRPTFLNMADEPGIGDQAAPFDFCYCNHCMRLFRQRMEARYGTLDAMNAAWGTDHQAWDAVFPLSTDETIRRAKADEKAPRNFASWNDHRAFMDDAFVEFFDGMRRDARQFWQFGLYSHGGNQAPNVFGGWDFAKIVNSADALIPYNIAGNDEVIRSLAPDLPKISPYFGDDPLLCRQLWHGALNWDLGFIFWDNNEEHGRFFDHKTGRPTKRAKLFGPVLREIKAGFTRQTRTWRRQDDPIAVLYSQPSMRAHWMVEVIESGEDWIDRDSGDENVGPRHQAIRSSWQKLIEDCNVSYRYVSYLDMAAGREDLAGFKVLVLTETASLSDAEANTIRNFVFRGGTLIVDGRCGIMDGNLVQRDVGALDDMFGVSQNMKLTHKTGRIARRKNQTFGDLKAGSLGIKVIDSALTIPADSDATVYAVAGETPSLVICDYGKGRTVFMNMDVADYRVARCDLKSREAHALQRIIRNALNVAGIDLAVKITDDSIGTTAGIAVHQYGAATAKWICMLNNLGNRRETGIGISKGNNAETFAKDRNLKLEFDRQAYTYLPREEGKYVGKVKDVAAMLPALSPLIVARLNYKVNSIRVHCDARHAAGEQLAGTVTLSTTAIPADHVIRLDVYDPDGTWCHWYSKNLVAKAGVAAFDISFALNDPRGRWKLAVRDVVTGLTAEKNCRLVGPPA